MHGVKTWASCVVALSIGASACASRPRSSGMMAPPKVPPVDASPAPVGAPLWGFRPGEIVRVTITSAGRRVVADFGDDWDMKMTLGWRIVPHADGWRIDQADFGWWTGRLSPPDLRTVYHLSFTPRFIVDAQGMVVGIEGVQTAQQRAQKLVNETLRTNSMADARIDRQSAPQDLVRSAQTILGALQTLFADAAAGERDETRRETRTYPEYGTGTVDVDWRNRTATAPCPQDSTARCLVVEKSYEPDAAQLSRLYAQARLARDPAEREHRLEKSERATLVVTRDPMRAVELRMNMRTEERFRPQGAAQPMIFLVEQQVTFRFAPGDLPTAR